MHKQEQLTLHRATPPRRPHWMHKTLHDLCQPLMALECHLYLALMSVQEAGAAGGRTQDAAAQRQTCEAGLHECQRMMDLVRGAQARMANETTTEWIEEKQ